MNEIPVEEPGAVPGADPRRRFAVWCVVAMVIVLLDQFTKLLVLHNVPLFSKIPVTSFINITHQENPGAAFSFLADAGGWQRWFFTVLAAGVSAFIVAWLWKLRHGGQQVLAWALALVLGGAIGNLVDRVRLGHVIDFIQVYIGSWPFPSFNVADAAISVGAVLLIVDALFYSGRDTATGGAGREEA